jgi:hypothetical protein
VLAGLFAGVIFISKAAHEKFHPAGRNDSRKMPAAGSFAVGRQLLFKLEFKPCMTAKRVSIWRREAVPFTVVADAPVSGVLCQ